MRGGAPLVLALALVPVSQRPGWRAAPAVLLAAVTATMIWMPRALFDDRSWCRELRLGKDALCVEQTTIATIEGTRALVDRFVHTGESVLIAPSYAGIYAALRLRAPNWDIYAISPMRQALEEQEIERLTRARTRLVILSGDAVDNRPELRFDATHPLTMEFLLQGFEVVPQSVLPPKFTVALAH
jgi:hypothetical protein